MTFSTPPRTNQIVIDDQVRDSSVDDVYDLNARFWQRKKANDVFARFKQIKRPELITRLNRETETHWPRFEQLGIDSEEEKQLIKSKTIRRPLTCLTASMTLSGDF